MYPRLDVCISMMEKVIRVALKGLALLSGTLALRYRLQNWTWIIMTLLAALPCQIQSLANEACPRSCHSLMRIKGSS